MPSRFTVIAILAFWLTTSSWLFYKEIVPRLLPDRPPPIAIDLADEAQASEIRWTIIQNGEDRGYARTWVHFEEPTDTFRVKGEFKLWNSKSHHGNPDQLITSALRLTREGELRHIATGVTMAVPLLGTMITATLEGEVIEHRFTPRLTVEGTQLQFDLPPVEIAERGSVLNPLAPVNRLAGVRIGQHWRMPLIDPVGQTFSAVFQRRASEVRFLDADVLPQTEILYWGGARKISVSCLIIDYTGDDTTARTWVREEDGLVLRQEVVHQGKSLILQRDYK